MFPSLFALAVLGGLVFFEKDLGTTMVLCAIFSAVYFAAGAGFSYWGRRGGNGRRRRGAILLAPWRVARVMASSTLQVCGHEGYQVVQSLYAIGSGGILAKVLQRAQKLFYCRTVL